MEALSSAGNVTVARRGALTGNSRQFASRRRWSSSFQKTYKKSAQFAVFCAVYQRSLECYYSSDLSIYGGRQKVDESLLGDSRTETTDILDPTFGGFGMLES